MLKLSIHDLKRNPGGSMAFHLRDELKIDETWAGAPISWQGPVEVEGEVHNLGGAFEVEGVIRSRLQVQCGRCLEYFPFEQEIEFKEIYYPQSVSGEEENEYQRPVAEEEDEAVFFRGDVINLAPEVAKNIFLHLPMKLICREDCRGLCPQCGVNLNREQCRCAGTNVDPRLAVLQKLLKEEN